MKQCFKTKRRLSTTWKFRRARLWANSRIGLPSSIELPCNPGGTGKEQRQVVTLWSGKTVAGEKKEQTQTALIVLELEIVMTRGETKEKETKEPKIASTSDLKEQGTVRIQLPPFPQRLKKNKNDEVQYQRFTDMLKQLHIDIPFTEVIEEMPAYAKFLKDMLTKKKSTSKFATVALTQSSKSIISPKMCDPRSFTIPCTIGGLYISQVLCDLAANINLMPLSIFKQLNVRQVVPTTVTLQLADRSLVHPERKVKDVLVPIEKFMLPADFIILNYEADMDVPIILGRPFLSTGRA
ncbi:uncharacterized protein LOC120072182 [Benincasa hispida]|uniref:uncharacterized protein LOC120072182 n=1 Tax=Benincasa hispida TaxID=102211 RepID=UPI001900BD31|nr:uncharacterized protein LOC120072182 [Benincasa hispida]